MWLEHLLFGACPKARRPFGGVYEGVFSDQSFLHTTVRTTATVRRPPEGPFIDNTERKDQRGKEKQKESLYNLEFRSFFELENIGTAISRQEQIRNDSQAARTASKSRDWGRGKRGALGKKIRANGGCLGYPEARKDVVSCEKARGTANRF